MVLFCNGLKFSLNDLLKPLFTSQQDQIMIRDDDFQEEVLDLLVFGGRFFLFRKISDNNLKFRSFLDNMQKTFQILLPMVRNRRALTKNISKKKYSITEKIEKPFVSYSKRCVSFFRMR